MCMYMYMCSNMYMCMYKYLCVYTGENPRTTQTSRSPPQGLQMSAQQVQEKILWVFPNLSCSNKFECANCLNTVEALSRRCACVCACVYLCPFFQVSVSKWLSCARTNVNAPTASTLLKHFLSGVLVCVCVIICAVSFRCACGCMLAHSLRCACVFVSVWVANEHTCTRTCAACTSARTRARTRALSRIFPQKYSFMYKLPAYLYKHTCTVAMRELVGLTAALATRRKQSIFMHLYTKTIFSTAQGRDMFPRQITSHRAPFQKRHLSRSHIETIFPTIQLKFTSRLF